VFDNLDELKDDYLLDDLQRKIIQKEAIKFLHKPSIKIMKDESAVVNVFFFFFVYLCLDFLFIRFCYPKKQKVKEKEELVYTDSAYYFDRETSLKLLNVLIHSL